MTKRTRLGLLRRLTNSIRRDIFPLELGPTVFRRRRVMQRSIAPDVRSRVVTKLVEAIEEVERLAKDSGKRTRKGGGGISPKERWYQLMGYLAQTLDGVLKNFDIEEVRANMDSMQDVLDELQRTTSTAG